MSTEAILNPKHLMLKKTGLALFAFGMLFFLISFTAVSKISPLMFLF
ncbi:MAG: hypothetical protein IPL53_07135 [Ignavibacteria bacterium]|nr:hypothetical protein [Ignavibacteria bacterium]